MRVSFRPMPAPRIPPYPPSGEKTADIVAETATEQFRRFTARCVLVATGLNSILVIALIKAGIFFLPLYHELLVVLQGICCFAFFLLLRRQPRYLTLAVWFYVVSIVLVSTCTDWLGVSDPMRFTWHFATNAAALAIGGLPAGIFATLASIASIVAADSVYEQLPITSLVTLCASLIVTCFVMALLVQYVYWMLSDLQASRDDLERLAHTDALTGLSNRLAFERHLASCVATASEFGLVILDLDRFKLVNDTYGHGTGDAVLQEVAQFLARYVGDDDIAARFGGEEFCLLLVGINDETGRGFVENIRQGIAALVIQEAEDIIHVTASFGFVHSQPVHRAASTLLSVADHALYEAKSEGRNRCVFVS